MLSKLEEIFAEFNRGIVECKTQADVLNFKAKYLGKQGPLTEILKSLKDASVEQKKLLGSKANEFKVLMENKVQDYLAEIETITINNELSKEKIDITLRKSLFDKGLDCAALHPVTLIQREIEDIFLSMGFEILDGPHIEDDFHNFEALNIPKDHPARDMQDTFWFCNPDGSASNKYLLRTHTSPIQVRGMESKKPPFKFVGPGKVFRAERTDASHEMVFHQLEGMMVDKGVSVVSKSVG